MTNVFSKKYTSVHIWLMQQNWIKISLKFYQNSFMLFDYRKIALLVQFIETYKN